MSLTKMQLEACAYLFEKYNGNHLDDSLEKVILRADLPSLSSDVLEAVIIKELNNGEYVSENQNGLAYNALGKRFNSSLIPYFKEWLKKELRDNKFNQIYQLMIALDNLEEPIFNPTRSGSSSLEIELNIRDAKYYLDNY